MNSHRAEHTAYPRTAQTKNAGVTIVELLFAALITGILVSIILFSFTAGERSLSISAVKIDTQSEARRALDWVVNDAREAVVWELASAANTPSSAHIKFRKVAGWNTTSDTFLLANNYTQYTYNATSDKLIRQTLDLSNNTLGSWQMNNIVAPPFFTRDAGGGIVSLDSANLLASRVLIVAIDTQDTFRSSELVNTSLISEVKIRNE